MLSGLLAEFAPYIIIALGAVGTFFGYTRRVKKNARQETINEVETAAVKDYVADRKEIDNAAPIDTDAVNARNRLRDRQTRTDD